MKSSLWMAKISVFSDARTEAARFDREGCELADRLPWSRRADVLPVTHDVERAAHDHEELGSLVTFVE